MSGVGYNPSLPDSVRAAFAVLRSSAENDRLAHGYVVFSTRPELRNGLVELLLQWLYCEENERPCGVCRGCRAVETGSHPDVIRIEPESKSRVISIEQMRDVNHFIRQTSFEGGWKAAVLLDAHRLNESSANAFLKTLEEPPPRCLLLLLTDSPQMLLPTILSRCQFVPLAEGTQSGEPSPHQTAVLDWLEKRTPRASAMEQSAWMSSVLAVMRENAEKKEKENAREEDDKETIQARVQAQGVGARIEMLRILMQWERDVLACLVGVAPESLYFPGHLDALRRQAAGSTLGEQLARLDRVEQARRLLEGNVPERSVMDAILPV